MSPRSGLLEWKGQHNNEVLLRLDRMYCKGALRPCNAWYQGVAATVIVPHPSIGGDGV